MLRVVRFVKTAVARYTRPIVIPEEFAALLSTLQTALAAYDLSAKQNADDFMYWDVANTARELYRSNTNTTFRCAYYLFFCVTYSHVHRLSHMYTII